MEAIKSTEIAFWQKARLSEVHEVAKQWRLEHHNSHFVGDVSTTTGDHNL